MPAENRELQERLGLTFLILSDAGLLVTEQFGLRHAGGRASTGEDKPFPTTFILDARGLVRAKFENESHRVRPDPQNVLVALKSVITQTL